MTVPDRVAAARLLLSLDPPTWHVRHSRAVAEVAGWLALRAVRAGGAGSALDRRLVEAAALLHDADKALSRETRGGGAHGRAGGAWLGRRGHPELETAVALHPVNLLVDDVGAATLGGAPLEAKVVAYADKRAGQRLEPMAARFSRWRRRHPHGWSPEVLDGAWRRALVLEAEVCAAAGCRPVDVRRLAWTGPAMIAAGAPGSRRERSPGSRP